MQDKTIKPWGITETTDPAFHLELFDNLCEGNTIITKRLTDKLIEKLVEHKSKIILHLTCTGMGGTKIEPFVPTKEKTKEMFDKLIASGFPVEQVVLRIDPIVPTEKGLETAVSVLDLFKGSGIQRVRISFLDMYKHVKERFDSCNIPLPYDTFHAKAIDRNKAFDKIQIRSIDDNFLLECCGEPGIASVPCLSMRDVKILGLDYELVGDAEQRESCSCPANKKQIIKAKPSRCANNCLYCYWK